MGLKRHCSIESVILRRFEAQRGIFWGLVLVQWLPLTVIDDNEYKAADCTEFH